LQTLLIFTIVVGVLVVAGLLLRESVYVNSERIIVFGSQSRTFDSVILIMRLWVAGLLLLMLVVALLGGFALGKMQAGRKRPVN
jgi:hypothetical protein